MGGTSDITLKKNRIISNCATDADPDLDDRRRPNI